MEAHIEPREPSVAALQLPVMKAWRIATGITWAFMPLQKTAASSVAEFGGPFVLQAFKNRFGVTVVRNIWQSSEGRRRFSVLDPTKARNPVRSAWLRRSRICCFKARHCAPLDARASGWKGAR